jgi:hypothetical protein
MATNITGDFIKALIANGSSVEGDMGGTGWGLVGAATGLIGMIVVGKTKFYDPLVDFRNKVRNGGDWDFKSNWLKPYKDTGVEVAGKTYRYDMPGNFHYGYVGSAMGVSTNMLLTQAGKAQRAAGTSKPEFHCTHGDDPEDHEFIRLGIKLYDDYELKVTETNLAAILGGFKTIVCGPVPKEKPFKEPFFSRR